MLESSIKNALSNYASYAQNDMVLARIERDLNNIFGDDVIRDVSFVGAIVTGKQIGRAHV